MVPLLGRAGLDRRAAAVDALHDLDLALADDLVLVLAEVGRALDEEGRVAGVAVGRLQHPVGAELGRLGDLAEVVVALDLRQRVGHARHAGLVADAHGLDLVVDAVAQRGLREPDVPALLLADALGLLVEHQEHELGLAAAAVDELDDLLVLQQVVVDVLDRRELGVRLLARAEDVRVAAVVAVDVADVLEVLAPLVDAEQVEVGRADEVDRVRVAVEEAADLRDVLEFLGGGHGRLLGSGGSWVGRVGGVRRARGSGRRSAAWREHAQAEVGPIAVDLLDVERAHEVQDLLAR